MQRRCSSFRVIASVAVLAAVTAACGASDGGANSPTTPVGPHDTQAEVRPDLMLVEPASAQAGALVTVTFPDERTRGVHFVLESRTGDGWNLEYHLVSDWGGDRHPTSRKADSTPFYIEDIGFSGGEPDVLLIPAEAPPGDYRVCTGNSRPNICAPIAVSSGN